MRGTMLAAAMLLALAPRAHASGWSEPKTIADGVETDYLDTPTLVAGPGGRLATAWTQPDGIRIAVARRRLEFGPAAVVPGSRYGYFPTLGLDALGNTTIAWAYSFTCSGDDLPDGCVGMRALARLKTGAFTPRRSLTPKRYDTFGPSVSVAPSGSAAVWWGGYGKGAGARVADRPGRFGRIEQPGREIRSWIWDRRGRNAEIVLQNKHSLVAFTRTPGGKLRHRRMLLKVAGPEFYAFHVGTDRHGVRSAAWEAASGGHAGRPEVPLLVVALRTLHGRLAPATLARDPGQSNIAPLAVDTGPSGFVVAAWGIRGRAPSEFDFRDAYVAQLRAAVSLPGRPFARSQLLQPRYTERPVYGAVDAAGPRSAVVAWRGTRPDGSQAIYAAHAGPHGRFAHAHLLTGDSPAPMSDPAVAVDARDNATVLWIDGLRVRVARFASGRG